MLVYKHVCTIFLILHNLHFTSQHQWKVQLHLSETISSSVLYPLPQHMRSQPSTPMDVSLHCLPIVPSIPNLGFFVQNLGESSKYTRSFNPGGLCSGLWGFNWKLYRFLLVPSPWPLEFIPLNDGELGPVPGGPSLFCLRLLLTITFEAPSNLSLRLSPMCLKLGSRIQHVFTVQEPDIPWHLHSCRISVCTCCER